MADGASSTPGSGRRIPRASQPPEAAEELRKRGADATAAHRGDPPPYPTPRRHHRDLHVQRRRSPSAVRPGEHVGDQPTAADPLAARRLRRARDPGRPLRRRRTGRRPKRSTSSPATARHTALSFDDRCTYYARSSARSPAGLICRPKRATTSGAEGLPVAIEVLHRARRRCR
jgi:hypothetical protein